MIKPMLLIVDDEKPTREGLRAALEERYDVYLAEDVTSAMGLLEKEHFDVLLTDFRLPNEDGLKLIARAKSLSKPPVCILMTAYGSEEVAVEAMKRGADDYIAKGRMQIDELEMRIVRALRRQSLETENESLRQQLDKKYGLENIIGESSAMQGVLEIVRQVAPSKANVLVTGESGTGKELVARAIHQLSPRARQTLVSVHCAGLPRELIESELFGHEKGAFTGAIASRPGRLELADGGTLFLDEVGDMALDLQSKLLRVLQEREFERLGSTRTRRVDVRVIAATNRDLEEMVEQGGFRRDLFYRLNVFPIALPPLRERVQDIPALAQYLTARYARRMRRPTPAIPTQTLEALCRWQWPGNIRELENVIQRALILDDGDKLRVSFHDLSTKSSSVPRREGQSSLKDGTRDRILRALRESGGVVAGPRGAAARLGVKRTTLQSMMRRLGIRRQSY